MSFSDLTSMLNINNVTNQNDPQSIRCRVFIGNLNTMQMTKQELEQIFSKYGFISGVSMHKGFAFVQFTNEINARLASLGEDQKVYYNMRVDVNIASEPKARRRTRTDANLQGNTPVKRNRIEGASRGSSGSSNPSVTATGARLSNLVSLVNPSFPNTGNSENADKILSMHGTSSGPQSTITLTHTNVSSSSGSVVERSSTTSHSVKSVHSSTTIHQESTNINLMKRNVFGKEVKDFLVCGVCKASFEHVSKLLEHKSEGCRLRFACRCKQLDEPAILPCAYCLAELSSAWELIKHCQAEHELTIYSLASLNSPTDQGHTAEGSEHSMECHRRDSKRHEYEVKSEADSCAPESNSHHSTAVSEKRTSPEFLSNAVGRSSRKYNEAGHETSKKSASNKEECQSRESSARMSRASARRRRGDVDQSDEEESDDDDRHE